jgi:hypothetical protein
MTCAQQQRTYESRDDAGYLVIGEPFATAETIRQREIERVYHSEDRNAADASAYGGETRARLVLTKKETR